VPGSGVIGVEGASGTIGVGLSAGAGTSRVAEAYGLGLVTLVPPVVRFDRVEVS
jgi:hypothetical protein